MKSWMKAQWTKLKGWVYAMLVTLGVVAGNFALADDVNLSWTNAVQYDDGSSMPISEIASTQLYKQSFPLGTDLAAEVRAYTLLVSVPPTQLSYIDPDQPNGIYCYVATHTAVNGEESLFSGEACKTVDVRLPGSPGSLNAN